jgi:outer membrane protein
MSKGEEMYLGRLFKTGGRSGSRIVNLIFVGLTLLLTLLSPIIARGQAISSGEALTLSGAIELGLKNHPSIMAAVSTVKVNEARIGEAKANYYPQISLTETYSKISPASAGSVSASTVGAGSVGQVGISSGGGSYDQYTTSANLSQTLYDFGKTTSQVKVQSLTTDSTRADLENLRDQVVLSVKQGYFNLLQTQLNREVAMEAVKQFQDHLRQAQGFYQVGTKPKFDVTKAEVDLSNARVSLIKVENQVRIARVTLNNAMGIPDAPGDYKLTDSLSYKKYDVSFEDALQRAYGQRSDLQSLIKKREAAKESINLSQKGYVPIVTGNASYYYTGGSFPLNNGWSMGASLSFPLFSGFLTRYQVLEAQSARDAAAANEAQLRQDILLQVQQGFSNLRDAGERIQAAEVGVRQGKENLDLANGRYQAGVGNPIEVTDSVVALANAEFLYNQALFDYKVAAANIEKAMGAR